MFHRFHINTDMFPNSKFRYYIFVFKCQVLERSTISKLRYRCSGHSENTVYLEWSDSCVNIHVLGQVALLGETFPTDFT